MPIVNAAFSNWTQSMISLPDLTTGVWPATPAPRACVTSEFRVQRLVDIAPNTAIRRGVPWDHMWDIGDAVWQIDFNTPFLIYLPAEDTSVEPLSGLQVFDYFMQQCIRVLPTSGTTLQELWEKNDFIVKSVSLTVNDDQAMVAVSMICTIDPRQYFYQQGYANFEVWGARICKPYDLKIPVINMWSGQTKNCIGGPMNIFEDRSAISYPSRTGGLRPGQRVGDAGLRLGAHQSGPQLRPQTRGGGDPVRHRRVPVVAATAGRQVDQVQRQHRLRPDRPQLDRGHDRLVPARGLDT